MCGFNFNMYFRCKQIFLKFDRKGRRPDPGCVSKPPCPLMLVRNIGKLTINIRVLEWLWLGLGLGLDIACVCVCAQVLKLKPCMNYPPF